ncbi:cytochrome P450 [Streptomyces sp. H51]|uniref:cytochrome P450 n=1 Tax=Streptomyces sp. H51 TaxID=3111770 RepID=UPI002D7A3601|nr:cytochrome P450 [Streptomyces sp. H51]
MLRTFQEDGGLHHITLNGTAPGWLVTDYDLAARVLTDPRMRGECPGSTSLSMAAFDALTDHQVMDEQQLFSLGADEHNQLRHILTRSLGPRRIARLTGRIQPIADSLLDTLPTGTAVDLGAAFARPYPVAALCALLGVPEEGRRRIHNLVFEGYPGMPAPDAAVNGPDRSVADYLADLIERRRLDPGDDLISDMCRDEGADVAHSAVLAAARLLIVVGPRPTAHLLTDGLALLLKERGHWEALAAAEPELLETVVEELLRFVSPASFAFRYAREEVEIGGAVLPAGSRAYCSVTGANRDPGRFPDPDRFDPRRPAGQHVAFGLGFRHCLGAGLVRAEVSTALATLVRRFPHMRLATPGELHAGSGEGVRAGRGLVVVLDPPR